MKKIFFFALLALFNNLYSQTYNWAKRIDSENISITKMLTTSTGDVIVGGSFTNTVDLDPGAGTFFLNSLNSLQDIFIAKYSTTGTFISAFKVGNIDDDFFYDFTIDNSGNIFLTGSIFGQLDINPGTAVNNFGDPFGRTSFIAKYTSNFSYQWAKAFDKNIIFRQIKHDSSGGVVFFGTFAGTVDFNPSATQTTNLISTAGSDFCLGKLSSTGTYSWVKKIGDAASFESASNLFVDASNNIFITGTIYGTVDFNPSPTITTNLVSSANFNLFFAKYNSVGALSFAKLVATAGITTNSQISPTNISTDISGNIILTGMFAGTVDFDPSSAVQNMVSTSTANDLFVVKYNNKASFLWCKKIGNSADDLLANHVLDNSGNIVLYGGFNGTVDFNPSTATYNLQSSSLSYHDLFVAIITPSGGFSSAFKIGSAGEEQERFMCIDKNNNILIAGNFFGTIDFDPSAASNKLTATGMDGFIARYAISGVNNPKIMEQEDLNTIAIDNNIDQSIQLYPNPTSERLNITVDGEIENIQVFDLIGKLYQNVTIDLINKTVNVSELPNNVYFLSVTIAGGTPIVSKFVKQ